jgi:hypothetical protein
MPAYELMRKVTAGPLTIRLWIDADDGLCEECEERADELALCASTLADEDDAPMLLAEKLANTLRGITKVEVEDETGNGGLVYPDRE